MEQFSHDLTLALEETSRCSRRWGMRRRTRSTGNLPCAPLPTEDSSSSQADHIPHNNNNVAADNNNMEGAMCGGGSNSIQSDSDDRQALSFALKLRNKPMSGNFESDSLNENFSPARPNTRRKRKFKRMAIEYETTTPSTPAHSNTSPLFPLSTVKKRVLKHTCQENFRANIFFCGKRKRSYRERYMEYESHKQHSSSVPRQSSLFTPKASYLEYRSRNRGLNKPCERILPLNKSIVSKIEKISAETRHKMTFQFGFTPERQENSRPPLVTHPSTSENDDTSASTKAPAQKSSSVDSTLLSTSQGAVKKVTPTKTSRKAKHRRRRHMKMQLQFDESTFMDCGNLNDLMSSSSLSSSDSEPVFANESDHEGDDELTDWPGNEAMINFASKHDFKRALKTRPKLPQILQMQDDLILDDDTLMSTEDVNIGLDTCGLEKLPGYVPAFGHSINTGFQHPMPCSSTAVSTPSSSSVLRSVSMPIDITEPYQYTKQIESEMSGDTSNNILSSPNTFTEVREIRAGCRRIGGTPGYSIITSVNEQLARFLQDDNQIQLRLFDVQEIGKLEDLAKLYSLTIQHENGCIVLDKTSKTMQSIRVDQSNFSKLYLSDYKRRCYGDDDSSEMAS